MLKLTRIVTLATIMSLIGELAISGTCGFWQQISFADGSKACLTDYPISDLIPGGFSRPLKVVNDKQIEPGDLIAISDGGAVCPLAIGVTRGGRSNKSDGSSDTARAIDTCNASLQGNYQSTGESCKCVILSVEMSSKFTKEKFEERVLPFTKAVSGDNVFAIRSPSGPIALTLRTGIYATNFSNASLSANIEKSGGEAQKLTEQLPQLDAIAQAKALADAQARSKAEAEALAKVQADAIAAAHAKAQAEAKALADAQARSKAEAEALAKVQADAKSFAEVQARLEAREKALVEAQARMQADAQAIAAAQRTAAVTSKLKSIALVIGNSNYIAFSKLPNPRNDARAIAQKLRSFGIEVNLVMDADRGTLVNALNDYQAKAIGRDVNIFYYAGHGLQINGVNYLIPTDMRADGLSAGYVKLNGVSVNDAMDYLPAKTRLVFLDACRDNPASRSLMASRGVSSVGLAPINAPSGTLVSYATKEGTTAEDGTGSNSPFTTALLENLDANLDISLVLRKVRQRVLQLTSGQQEPWEYGSLTGDQLVISTMSR